MGEAGTFYEREGDTMEINVLRRYVRNNADVPPDIAYEAIEEIIALRAALVRNENEKQELFDQMALLVNLSDEATLAEARRLWAESKETTK